MIKIEEKLIILEQKENIHLLEVNEGLILTVHTAYKKDSQSNDLPCSNLLVPHGGCPCCGSLVPCCLGNLHEDPYPPV